MAQVARWGNSLAVRIPAKLASELRIKEGDGVQLCRLSDGQVGIITEQQRRAALMARAREIALPLPSGYKFDREEANAR